MPKIRLPYGVRRKLYVDRKRASCLLPPLVVEEPDGDKYYARHVAYIDNPREPHNACMRWAENNTSAPNIWEETEAELELTV